MLKPSGVFAICIDHRELYRLGLLLDKIFGEENRLGIINWQKSTSPRPDNRHVSTSTEYVIVYAKDKIIARTIGEKRSDSDNSRYANIDGDLNGEWREGNLTAKSYSTAYDYAIQSPFTGELHYPAGNGAWRHPKRNIKKWLKGWGLDYVEKDIKDSRRPALVVKGSDGGEIPRAYQDIALQTLQTGQWPFIWFGRDGKGRPRTKTYLEHIKKGKVPVTYWANETFCDHTVTDSVSWDYTESGRSSDGVSELTGILGPRHRFETVKPLKLFKKIIEIWCPPDGIVMDPFAGSGTTGHAVLELNYDSDARRRFVMIEQGRPNKRDDYARTLTAVRTVRALTGERVTKDGEVRQSAHPLPGGFRFSRLSHHVDLTAVLALEREEMIDLLVTSHWDQGDRNASFLRRLPAGKEKHLFGIDGSNRGYFLVWDGPDEANRLNRMIFKGIVAEAKAHSLSAPYHVYARLNTYDGPNVEFYQIPDRILEKLGVNTSIEPFSVPTAPEESAA